jgi:hypothetical protein
VCIEQLGRQALVRLYSSPARFKRVSAEFTQQYFKSRMKRTRCVSFQKATGRHHETNSRPVNAKQAEGEERETTNEFERSMNADTRDQRASSSSVLIEATYPPKDLHCESGGFQARSFWKLGRVLPFRSVI